MRAIAVEHFRETPRMMDVPRPTPGPGQILVRLSAAGVNPFDWKILDGSLDGRRPHVFPLIAGVDGAGVVEEVGSGTTRFVVGDGVYGQFLHDPVGEGTYAEFVAAPESIGISKTPRGIYSTQAAAVPTAGMTALDSLDRLGVKKGHTLAIFGAAGGIGSFATQLAANMDVHVIAIARGKRGDYLRKLGAWEYFDSENSTYMDDFGFSHPSGVDAILDTVHRGAEFEAVLPSLKEGGIAASTIGAVDMSVLEPHHLRGVNIDLQPTAALLDRLSAEISVGRLRVPLDAQVPLANAAEALQQSRDGVIKGKMVLQVEGTR